MEYIRIGAIVKPHGIKGSLKIKTFTSFVRKRFEKNSVIYRFEKNKYIPVTILNSRSVQGSELGDDDNIIYITFKDYEDINEVESWRNQELFIVKEELHELDKDEVYYFQLKDAQVYEGEIYLGVVSELIETGANLVLRVQGEQELLIPYVNEFIENVDTDHKKVYVKLIEGMR